MAYTPISIILLLSLTPSLFLHIQHIHAQTPSAPAPSPPGPINLTAILDKAGQYNTFIRLLTQTQAGNQIDNQVNSSTEGLTVFAPTDNAFSNLPPGTLNKLSDNQQVQLILYHVLPKFYTVQSLETVSNPVRTQASGQDGQPFGLNFTGQSNQLNVSTGVVDTQIYNALRKDPPLAVYQVDKVLLPLEITRSPAPASSPPSSAAKPKGGGDAGAGNTTTTAGEASPPSPGGAAQINVGLGFVSGLLVLCMGMFS